MLSKLVAHHRNGRPFHLWGTRVKVADETSIIIQFWIRSKRKRNLILIMSSESKRNRQLHLDGWVCKCPFVGPWQHWAKACTEAIWYSNPFWFYWCGALFYERKKISCYNPCLHNLNSKRNRQKCFITAKISWIFLKCWINWIILNLV